MAKRRRVLMGMGALVFGSGAMSVNAAFNDSVNANSSDMRVVSAEQLVVEPGISFRSGSSPDDSYSTTLTGPEFYSWTNADFFDNNNPSTNTSEPLGSQLSLSGLPAVSVSNGQNGSLDMRVATLNQASSHTFSNVLQVRNNGDSAQDVGIKFATFGVDTDGDQNQQGGTVSEGQVPQTYEFRDPNNNDEKISTDNSGPYNNGVTDQSVANFMTVDPGQVRQVNLEVDIPSSVVSDIASASQASTGAPWGGDHDTVQLVDTIQFGSQ